MSRVCSPTNVQPDDGAFRKAASAVTAAVERADSASVAAVRHGPEEGGSVRRPAIPTAVPPNQAELAPRAFMQECDLLHGADGNKCHLWGSYYMYVTDALSAFVTGKQQVNPPFKS